MIKLFDVAEIIRSKNSGPYELTFDIMFKEESDFENFVAKDIMTKAVFARLYKISESDVLSIIPFTPSKAVKITIVRPVPSGSLGEKDVYGAQQHGPLLNFKYKEAGMQQVYICQSCELEMTELAHFGTNSDGAPNHELCTFCWPDGGYASWCRNMTMEDMANNNIPFLLEAGLAANEQEALEMSRVSLPKLKRWAR